MGIGYEIALACHRIFAADNPKAKIGLPEILVGIFPGAGGTTRDTFELLAQSKRHGARLALFGRKINQAESPLDLIEILRRVADDELTPADGVSLYHDRLTKGRIPARIALDEDQLVSQPVLKAA